MLPIEFIAHDIKHPDSDQPIDGCMCITCDEQRLRRARRAADDTDCFSEAFVDPVLRLLVRGLAEVGWAAARAAHVAVAERDIMMECLVAREQTVAPLGRPIFQCVVVLGGDVFVRALDGEPMANLVRDVRGELFAKREKALAPR